MFRSLLALAALLLIAAPAVAQDDLMTPFTEPIVHHPDVVVQEATLIDADTLAFSGVIADGCDAPLEVMTDRQGRVVRFVLTRTEVDPDCLPGEAAPVPFTIEIELPPIDDPDLPMPVDQLIEANDFVTGIFHGPADAPGLAEMDPLRVLGIVESLSMEDGTLTVRGQHPDGCEAETLVWRTVDTETRRINANVYRILPGGMFACPAVLRPFEVSLSLPDDLSGVYRIEAGEMVMLYDFDNDTVIDPETLVNRYDAQIDELTAVAVTTPQGNAINVYITGRLTAGCAYPALYEQQIDETTITLGVYQELPDEIACPRSLQPFRDVLRLNGPFEPGTYTISIYGVSTEVEIGAAES